MSAHHSTHPGNAKSPSPPPLPKNWPEMTRDEKLHYFTTGWASTDGKTFASPEIESVYQRRAQRWLDVLALKKPDRVPDLLRSGEFALINAGIKPVDRFYHQENVVRAVLAFHEEFNCDYSALGLRASGKALELLGYKLIRWPGSSLSPSHTEEMQFQYVEGEYMAAEDYDELLANPDGFMLRKYVPRICEGLKALTMAPSLFRLGEVGGVVPMLMPLAAGPLRQALDALIQAADQTLADMQPYLSISDQIQARFGAPTIIGGIAKAPFDILGDTMRGTRGIMLDMYRRPDKVIAACESIVPASIQIAVQSATFSRVPFILMPLHKGADGFMSSQQFETFYWPSLKALLLGMIDAGVVPLLFVEGSYDQRLDIITASGLPAGKTMWLFDRTDMKAVKEKIGGFACIGGNVPASLFSVGTPEMMENCCKKVIETAATDGGFFLSPGAAIDQAKPENVHAFLNSKKKFGTYSA